MLKIVIPGEELNDGHWHQVTITQQRHLVTLQVDSMSQSKIIREVYFHLNLKGNLFIGGMRFSDYKINLLTVTKNFRGCIENLIFRGKNLLREAANKRSGYKIHGTVKFECKELDYRVVTMANPNTGYKVTVRKLPADNDTFSTSFQFRSHTKEGLLLSRSAVKVKLHLRLSGGALFYDVTAPNGSKTVLTLGSKLDDGEWHKVNASVRERELRLQLDGQTRTKPLNHSLLLMLDFANKSRFKIFLGNYDKDFPGFVGCLLNLQIDSQRITLKNLKKSKHTNDDLKYMCRLLNHCEPNPCKNHGKCSQDWKGYHCDCEYTQFEGRRCDISIYKPTCEYYRSLGLKSSQYCLLDSEGEGTPYTALCNITQDLSRTYTIITHNKMTKTGVGETRIVGSLFRHDVTYTSTDSMEQIRELIRKSKKCRQHIRFHCLSSKLLNSPNGPSHAFWLSHDGNRQDYWGGADPGSKKCACGMPEPSSCEGTAKFCNCDNKDRQWRVDEGYLTDKSTLPVTGLEFSKKSARSDFTLGPLECWGNSDKEEIPTIKPKPQGQKIDSRLVRGCPNVESSSTPTPSSTTWTTQKTVTVSNGSSCPADDGVFAKDCTNTPTRSPNVTITTPHSGHVKHRIQTTPTRKNVKGNGETNSEMSAIAVVSPRP